jgi:hypothetical protein
MPRVTPPASCIPPPTLRTYIYVCFYIAERAEVSEPEVRRETNEPRLIMSLGGSGEDHDDTPAPLPPPVPVPVGACGARCCPQPHATCQPPASLDHVPDTDAHACQLGCA